jgi:type IV pilus assembly protein PilX
MSTMPVTRARQSGAILVVSLLLLLVLTILGIMMMQTTRLQERMSGNTRDLNAALQGAEAGLRAGEGVLANAVSRPAAATALPCNICEIPTLPVALQDDTQFNWLTMVTSSVALPGQGQGQPGSLHDNPQYVIEHTAFVTDELGTGQDPPQGRDFYEVTARSTGLTTFPRTVLQSTYARRF